MSVFARQHDFFFFNTRSQYKRSFGGNTKEVTEDTKRSLDVRARL